MVVRGSTLGVSIFPLYPIGAECEALENSLQVRAQRSGPRRIYLLELQILDSPRRLG
jgi:hypothetical protein